MTESLMTGIARRTNAPMLPQISIELGEIAFENDGGSAARFGL
jgi:hypothetical protein